MITPTLDVANSARAAANRARAAALIAIAERRATIADVVRAAASDSGASLLRLTLRQVLLAQPTWGEDRARAVADHINRVCGTQKDRMTLAWVLDSRAAGRRFMAFCDAVTPNNSLPWPGYPYAKKLTTAGSNQ